MSAREFTPIRARRGRRVHAMTVGGDGDGEAACGRRAPGGWRLVVDAAPDCVKCLLVLALSAGKQSAGR